MNLYLYDQKHERVLAQMSIPAKDDVPLMTRVIEFLEINEITNRYKSLALADSYELVYDEGEPTILFEYDDKLKKKEFEIKVSYFKPSGKYHIHTTFKKEFETINCDPYTVSMQSVVEHIKGIKSPQTLPGLITSNWDGFILVDCEQGYPCLIVPEGMKK